jgi:hypothetical protein
MGRESNKKRRATNATSAREKAAAAKAEQRRADQRRRAIVILSSIVALVVVGVVVAVIAINSTSKPSTTSGGANSVAPAVLSGVTSVTPATAATVGAGTSAVSMKPINGPALAVNGKPDFLYVGAEFCPFCAAERWSIVQALSRFGSFSGLSQIQSSEDNFSTFDFKDSIYTSKYLTFSPREVEDQNRQRLQTLTPTQTALFKANSPDKSFPFLYLGGKYVQTGAGYDPTVLTGLTHQQIASQLNDPTSPVAKAIVGEANVLTAAVCGMTNNTPSNVCSNATISGLQTKINGQSAG